MSRILIDVEGSMANVPRKAYVTAKTKQLRAFGYPDLTEKSVDDQITAILEGKELDVIGMFMEREVIVPKEGK